MLFRFNLDSIFETKLYYGVIRCLDGSGNLQGDAITQSINSQTQVESWRLLSTWIQCNSFTEKVQVIMMFHQLNFTTDEGTAFFDDVDFSQVQ